VNRTVYFRELTTALYPLWLDCNTRLNPATGCRLWVGAPNNRGYGMKATRGRRRSIGAWVYECLKGPIPDGLEIDHLCRRPLCVWIDHLEAVPHAENIRRSWRHKRGLVGA
jgi:hypothetical protein